jgi:hypothetical protein
VSNGRNVKVLQSALEVLGWLRGGAFHSAHNLSMLQWWSQKIGSSGDMSVIMFPAIVTCTWSCGVRSSNDFAPRARCQLGSVLFCSGLSGRVLPNNSNSV